MKPIHRLIMFVVGAAMVGACSPPEQIARIHKTAFDCYEGCQDVDSFPDSAGIFVTNLINPADCSDAENWTDSDYDGLTDRCESSLAEAFQPQLYYSSNDADILGERNYAARSFTSDSGAYVVSLLYMPSYYEDGGNSMCGSGFITFFSLGQVSQADLCPHYGDSEAIYVDLHYWAPTHHWIVANVYYSAHN